MNGPGIKGWCPSLFEPMAAGDGFLVRVKPRVEGISTAQLRALAEAGAKYGSGRIEITNRGNFQLRGFSAASVAPFAAAMLEAGLASAEGQAERRRNIAVAPGLGADMMGFARRLEAWLEQDDRLHALPAKFGFAVGEVADIADICILPGAAPLVVLPGHGSVPASDPLATVQALTHAFLVLAAGLTPRPRRLRDLLATIGADSFCSAAAGLTIQAFAPAESQPELLPGAFALGLAFDGQTSAQLRRAADLAERFGNGRLRTTIDRTLLLLGVGDHIGLVEAAREQNFIVDPADPRRRIKACAGRPGCGEALADVRAVAAGLAPLWAGPGTLHVSGCAKGCAAPSGAAVTLVATAREDRFDIVCDKRADALPDRAGVSLPDAIHWMTERQFCR
jgi:sulfite reductase beta subunit-like hemoprotein